MISGRVLQGLLEARGPAEEINERVFAALMGTLTSSPGTCLPVRFTKLALVVCLTRGFLQRAITEPLPGRLRADVHHGCIESSMAQAA